MDKKPFVGQLDRHVSIVDLVKSQSSTGSETTTENELFKAYAKMVDTSGGEVEEGKVIHLYNRNYIVRYRSEIVAKSNQLIVVDGAQKFEVVHVIEIGRKEYLKLIVKAYE